MASRSYQSKLLFSLALLVLPSLAVANCAAESDDDGVPTSSSTTGTGTGATGGSGGPGGSGSGGTDGGTESDALVIPDAPQDTSIGDGCVSETAVGELVPLDMLILQDRSGSMTSNDKWGETVQAIKGFADSPAVIGLYLGLQYFPPKAGDECQPATYQNVPVPIALLPGNATAIKSSLDNTTPSGLTPMRPGLEGAIEHMKTYLGQNPNHEGVVILVTDGDPGGCTNNTVSAVSSAAAAGVAGTPPVRTFVIGMDGASFGNLDQIAAAGGTTKSFNVSLGASVQAELAKALEEIRTQALSCAYVLPIPEPSEGTLDPDSVEVNFTPGINEPPVAIPKVAGKADCGEISGGFYYDDPVTPTQIVLCPASCEAVQAGTQNASVKVVLGCIVPPPT